MDLLKPKWDIVFKMIFADPKYSDVLIEFLKSVLDLRDDEYSRIEIADSQLGKEYPDDKIGILDVKVVTNSGHIVDVEIQLAASRELMRSRITYYLARMLSNQLSAGDTYIKLKRTICVVIVDFPLVNESEKCHTLFEMRERDEHFLFNNLMQINVLDLGKISAEPNEAARDWMTFIGSETEEDFEMVATKSPAIGKAYARLKEMSADEKTRRLVEARRKQQMDRDSEIAAGRDEGRAENQRLVVLNMINMGFDDATIAKIAACDQEEVRRIRA
jgi:predicted transposase/invertase (TIGR01784 family)